ncbi:unnamed protein product [Brassicogethes aeneus]|uniref:PID domain-containing protein n=1 Tax=Brassicogethes aeneus TaxID=1431903 RepID=A0A9P0B1X8_BRAAE|nr:unnamed protein product [Brassicogethes aeneus]
MSNNDKNETTRFLGDGVSFKAKLIGILEVSEARGDRMCQEALSDLKMAIRAAGEHKQRITINIAIDGLRLRDEKTGDSLYHHPVHKISFIAQDMTDSRAFGYIFGSPDTGHRFFGIKTDKAASQVVIAMRDLFQVVFALKKKEIELAKQHLEKSRYPSPIFSDSSSGSKLQSLTPDNSRALAEAKSSASALDAKKTGTAVADLVDLELELNSLQQGLNQMERITPSDPFGSKDDPFGDSFISYPKPILPPPPSGRERASRASESSSVFSPKTPNTADSANLTSRSGHSRKDFSFSHDFVSSREETSGDWFTPSNSIFEEALIAEPTKDEKHELAKQEILSQFDVFTELDPLELKNPPKKVLNDLVPNNNATASKTVFSADPFGEDPFVREDPFAETDFSKQDPFETEFNEFTDQFKAEAKKYDSLHSLLQSTLSKSPKSSVLDKTLFDDKKVNNKFSELHENPSLDMSSESECAPEPPPRPASTLMQIKPPPLPPKKQNDIANRPPPRPPHAEDPIYDYMDNYETAPNSLEYFKGVEKSPPLPVPARKSKFESAAPERPKKHFNNLQHAEEDYLTPVCSFGKSPDAILLPPPQRSRKQLPSLEGLDITLSQLTLSGLNELANKLKIPPSQLSNMTLVQLTNYLSNFIKSQSVEEEKNEVVTNSNDFSNFQADFAGNFNNLNPCGETYDRYAVFRELIEEEIKQTKIDGEPEQLHEEEEEEEVENNAVENSNSNFASVQESNGLTDRYAALREIVEIELIKQTENYNEETNTNENMVEVENKLNSEDNELKDAIISVVEKGSKSPVKTNLVKSPVPSAVTEIVQNNARLTSGSLSDVISGSSPEIDNTGSNSEKKNNDATGESWAIFDQANVPSEPSKEKQQSEEGVSPWSSDSKEFGNGSPTDWKRGDSGSEQWPKKRREQEGWWDTSAEPEAQYYPPSNRRSTDSYDEEYYECYDRPRRRRPGNWASGGGGAGGGGGQHAAGGHSSSSRDASPWEEEPTRRREVREPREGRDGRGGWGRHQRQASFERHRRHTADSWDEEDDYEYEDEKVYWSERHGREAERDRHSVGSREADRDRHSAGSREHEGDRWGGDDWSEDRRHRRRREVERSRDRWCCPDYDQGEHDKVRYGSGRWRDRKHDDRYYSRESQDSPWEDDYSNDPEESSVSPHYSAARSRNWKQRPSSASEMDRKTGEIKSRHHLGTGGSDGERDRRYKGGGRRSRSRDSQYSEPPPHRHKVEAAPASRNPHRTKPHHQKPTADVDFTDGLKKTSDALKFDLSAKKSNTLARRDKKVKESPKSESGTFPRKSSGRKSLFENDFVSSEDGPKNTRTPAKFDFENDFETSEAESPTVAPSRTVKGLRQQSMFEKGSTPADREPARSGSFKEPKLSPRYSAKSKSLFEDDFSPCGEKADASEDNNISSIKEEVDPNEEGEDTFAAAAAEAEKTSRRDSRKKILSTKNRLSGGLRTADLKKSESVNIFARGKRPVRRRLLQRRRRRPRSGRRRPTEEHGTEVDRRLRRFR